ncbi:hypothetical protein QTH87_21585 [Variovorax sp. J22P168]|uniref:KfrB domain-containing protein n=1 Tax=Variovorax jilinensis TaxID=3053513 RepID=UPI00257903E6|nr:hypothetical protein [Variovorax sp. J22P168]MDM0015052.1 hypothetical protein [Variovorax sp. J22P168]
MKPQLDALVSAGEVGAPAPALPEVGRSYRGPITFANATTVIQRMGEGEHARDVRHERAELHGRACAQLVKGANVEIRYPSQRLGFVNEWDTRERQASVAKGIEPRGLGD